MTQISKVEDVLEIAIRLERNGVDFYLFLKENTKSPKAKDVFSYLAAEEEKHIGTFRQILDKIADYPPRYSYPGEYELYLQAIADFSIFNDENIKEEMIQEPIDTNKSLRLGIEMEKQSILLYTEVLKTIPEEHHKIINEVIDEEKQHLAKLASLVDHIKF